MSFKLKLLSTFIVYGFILVLITLFSTFKLQEIDIKNQSIKKAHSLYKSKKEIFDSYIRDNTLKLSSIQNSTVFNNYLDEKVDQDTIESLFLDIASTADNIMQLRFIDKNGIEKVRVDRSTYASKAYLIDKSKLQDKSNRYYFKEIFDSKKNVFWYSKLDLNIENGQIEKPVKPVLRIGIPIFYKGVKKGVLIINIFMKNFLQELTKIPLYNIYMYNDHANMLVDSIHERCWSEYLESNVSIKNPFQDELHHVISNKEYFGSNFYSNKIFSSNSETIYILIEPKQDPIREEIISNLSQLSFILIGVIIISFPFSYFFARIPSKLKEEVDSKNAEQNVLLSLFDLSSAVLFKWNNDKNWSVNSVSKSVIDLLGYTQDEFIKGSILYSQCIHSDDLAQVLEEVNDAIKNDLYYFEHKPYRIVTKNSQIKWVLDSTVVVRNKNNEIINFVGYLTEITTLKQHELDLEDLSRTDQLTKISNRMHLDDVLQHQYSRFKRMNESCSLILIDIDYFKAVNDEYGHLVGDSVLIEFASLLQSHIRLEDTLGRWGGEEFLVILPHTHLTQAVNLAEKLCKIISSNIFTTVKHKTASFGIAVFQEGLTVENTIDKADNALYQSKKNGRNQVTYLQDLV